VSRKAPIKKTAAQRMMRNNSSISLHHPNGLSKRRNKDSNDIGVDESEGDFYWYQILILPIRTLFPIFFFIRRLKYKSICEILFSHVFTMSMNQKARTRGNESNYWLYETCKALTSSYFNGNLNVFLLFLWNEFNKIFTSSFSLLRLDERASKR
jgi:hypothetical protein